MSEVIKLVDIDSELVKVENEIRKGGVVVLPVEESYVYVADAFNSSAVKRIHELRGDELGVACAVAIGSKETLSGITSNLSVDVVKIIEKFWPGPLTLYLQPNSALTWDLGDDGELGEFAVRMFSSDLILRLARNIGPLAFASAAVSGRGVAVSLENVGALLGEINFYVDGGDLTKLPSSTVLREKVIGSSGLEIVRLGAISLEQLQEILPNISLAESS